MSARYVVVVSQFVELVRLFITPFIKLLITSFHDVLVKMLLALFITPQVTLIITLLYDIVHNVVHYVAHNDVS